MSETKISAVLTVEGLRKFQSDMNTAADAVDNTGKRGSAAGAALKRGATVGFLAAGAAAIVSVKKFASLDDALNRVQINSGASAKEMVKLEKVARKMGEKFPASGTEVAEAMNEILKAGMSVEDMLSGGLENALAMATAEGMDMATAANVMSNAMNTFGVSGKNANEVAAALSNVASKTSADVNDLALSLGQVGGTADTAGWSISETTAALGILIQRGLTGSKAGTSLNNMLSRMMSAGGEAKKAMKELGIEVYDSNGKMKSSSDVLDELADVMNSSMTDAKRNGLLMKAFGIDGLDAARNLGKARGEVAKLTVEAQKVDAPVQKAKDQMKSLGMQIDTTQESLGNMAMQFGAALAPSIASALPYVQQFADYLGSNAGVIADFAGDAVSAGANIAQSLAPALSTAAGAAVMIGGALQGVIGVLAALPSGTIQSVAAWAALTAVIVRAVPIVAAASTALSAMSGAIALQGALSGATGAMATFSGAVGVATIGVRALGVALLANPLFMAAGAAAAIVGVAAAITMVGSSSTTSAGYLDQNKAAADRVRGAYDAIKGAVNGVIDAQLALSGSSLAVERAQMTHAQAMGRTAQLEKDGKKGTTEWKDAVLSQKEAWQQVRVAKEQNAKADDDLAAKQKALADKARETDKAIVDSKKRIKEMTDELKSLEDFDLATFGKDSFAELVPGADTSRDKIAKLKAGIKDAQDAMNAAQGDAAGIAAELDKLAGSGSDADGRVQGLKSALDNLPPSKTIDVTVNVKTKGDKAALKKATGGIVDGFAGGGRVFGAGTGTSDSVPAMLSAGEWVLTAKQAKAIGYGTLAAIPKFGKGGPVAIKSSALTGSIRQARVDANPQLALNQATAQYNAALKAQRGKKGQALKDAKATTKQRADAVVAARAALAQSKRDAVGATGSAVWQQSAMASATAGLGDDLAAMQAERAQLAKLKSKEAADRIKEVDGEIWTMLNVTIPQQQRSQAVVAIGATGSDMWKRASIAGATETLDDDLAALYEQRGALAALGTEEAAARIAETDASIWTMLNITMPAQQAAAIQNAIGQVGAKGSDLWKRSSMAGVTETLDDDLAVLQERLVALQAFGPAAAAQIADAEADIWTMTNITMKAKQDQVEGWKNEAAMALGRGFYSASGGAGGGSNMGITDSAGGDAGGVGHAPRPEIDRVWLAGQQLNDLDARSGNGVEIVEILGWDEAEDFESTRSKRADGDALGGTRDGSVRLVVRGRLTGSTYQDYHERRRALKNKVRNSADQTLLKVPDVTFGDDETDYPSVYSASGMAGMERRIVRLTANLKWGDTYGLFGSEFEFELRSPHRFVESDVASEAPSGTNAAAMSAVTTARTSILAIRGEVAAAPAMDSALKFAGTSAASEIAVRSAASDAAVDTFTKITDPASLPAGAGQGAAFDPTGTYLVVCHTTTPYITIYKRSGDTFTKLPDPATLPAGNAYNAAWDPTGTYLTIGHTASPYITIYKRSGDTFTKLANPSTLPSADTTGEMAFDATSTYLAISGTTPLILIYKRAGDVFTKLADPAVMPTGSSRGAAFDPSSTYLAVAHGTTPYITIYKRSGDTFTKLPDPSLIPGFVGNTVSWDPTGTYLVLGHNGSPYMHIYKRSGDTFSKLPDPSVLPGFSVDIAAWDPTGTYLSVAGGGSPYVVIYKRSGDVFTKLADPASLPSGAAMGAAWDQLNGAYLAIATTTAPYIAIYAVSGSDAAFSPLGILTANPPSLAISSRTDTLPVASADISSSQPLTSQDSFDIDTIAGTATPVHRTPLARLIGGNSFVAGIIPSRYAGGPTTMLEVVTRSAAAGTALAALAAFTQSNTDVVNSTAGGEDDYVAVLGALTASPAQVATGMPGWRAKRSAANFTASAYARRRIDAKLGQPKSLPVIHTMMVKPAASWATATTDLNAFGSGVTKFAHLLTHEIKSVSSTNYVNAVGFYHNGTRLVPACVRYDDKATDGYRFTHASGALSITPDPAAHVWVAAILDAGTNIWNAIILVDVNTGEPLMWFVEGHDMFDKGATETTGATSSQATTTTSSGTRASNVAYPTAAERYIGCGSDTAGWAASVAGTTVPAGGMGAIITLDAAAELFDYGITDATMLTGAASSTQYTAISASIVEWVRARFAPQAIRRDPIALEVEWTDRVPDLHGEPIIRLDSIPASATLQALGASRTGGLSTEQMVTAAAGGAGQAVIEAREVR